MAMSKLRQVKVEMTPRWFTGLNICLFCQQCYGNVALTYGAHGEMGNACILLGNCRRAGFENLCVDWWRVDLTLSSPWRHLRGVEVVLLTSVICGDERSAPLRFTPERDGRYPLNRRFGGPHTRSWFWSVWINPLPVQFKSLLPGQEGCVFFSPQQQTNIPTWISMTYFDACAWIMFIHVQICLLSDFITSGNTELLFRSHNAIFTNRTASAF
jgi:hypothetical protein